MNNCSFIGRLTKDPELLVDKKGEYLCKFSIAVNRYRDAVDYVDCVAFKKTAESISRCFSRGVAIGLTGSMQSNTYTNKSGFEVKAWSLNVRDFYFIEKKREAQEAPPKAGWPEPTNADFMELGDQDLPF